MGLLDKMLDRKKQLTPKSGCNLIVIDDFEPPDQAAKLIRSFATEEEALAEKARREKDSPGNEYIILKPGD